MSGPTPVESLAGGGAPHWSPGRVARCHGAGAGMLGEGRVGSGLSVPVLTGLRDAADARGGAAHRMVPSVAELRHAGGAGVAGAVAWQRRWQKCSCSLHLSKSVDT